MSEQSDRPDQPQHTNSEQTQAWASSGEAAQRISDSGRQEQLTAARESSGATPTAATYSVLPAGGAWHVKHGEEVLGRYDDRDGALAEARRLAGDDRPSRVIIHGDDRRPAAEEKY
jgi:hypothetical protein